MKLFDVIAAAAMGVPFIAAVPGHAQTSIAPTQFMKKSECTITTPKFNNRCNYVMITSGNGSTNIHFSKDKIGSQSISFVIVDKTFDPSKPELPTAGLFVRNPNPTQIRKPGSCMISESIVRCTTEDGKYSAAAAD